MNTPDNQQTVFPLNGILINVVLITMTLGILIYSLMYSRRVYKIFKLSEVPLFFNMICINLSCVMYMVNSSLYISYLVKYS